MESERDLPFLYRSAAAIAALAAMSSVVGMAFPYGFPLFSGVVAALFLLALLLFCVRPRLLAPQGSGRFFLALYIILLVGYAYAWMRYGGRLNFVIDGDFKNALSVSVFLAALFIVLRGPSDIDRIVAWFGVQTIAAMTLVGIAGLYKFYALTQGQFIERYRDGALYPQGSSLVADYNFYALAHLIAFLFAGERFIASRSAVVRSALAAASVVFVVNIALAGSRRGFVMLAVVVLVVFLASLRGSLRFTIGLSQARLAKQHIGNAALILLAAAGLSTLPAISVANLQAVETLIYRAETLSTTFGSERGGGAFSERTVRWGEAYQLLEHAPVQDKLFGRGFDYYDAVARAMGSPQADYPHNMLLSLWLSNGAVGLTICIVFLLMVGYMAWTLRGAYPALALIYGVMLVYINTSGDQLYSIKPFPVMAALVFFSYRLRRS